MLLRVYLKMFKVVLYAVLFSTFSLVNCDEEDILLDELKQPALSKIVKMRCTRRFSPGVCAEEVTPVWTFTFQDQNCTERLGCPNNHRSNRFRSYRTCMKRCHSLVDVYLNMLEYHEKNATRMKNATNSLVNTTADKNNTDERNLRVGLAKYYKTRNRKKKPTLNLEHMRPDFEEEEYGERVKHNMFIVYKDTSVNEDILPPDVDDVAGEIRSEFDLLHW